MLRMIPEGWKSYRLCDVTEIIGGGTPSTVIEEYWNGPIPWLTPRDLTNYHLKYINKGERSITEKGLSNSSARLLPEGTVLLTSRAPIGYLAIAGNPVCTNQGFKSFITDDAKVDNIFLYYLLKNNIEQIKSLGSGTTFAEVSGSTLKEIEFIFPESKSEQSCIASILLSIDDKIELNLQMNKTLEAITQAIFKEWFVDFRFPGFDGELVDGLPKGWRKGKLGEIIKNFDSKRVPVSSQERAKRKGIYPYYGAASLMDYIDNYLFDGTFLLMGEDGSVIDDNGYPVLQYVWGKFWVNNHAHVIQGSNSFSTEYIYILLQRTQISNIVTGAVQPKINQGNLNAIECIIPDNLRLKEFNKLVLPLFDRIKVNHDENILLTSVRDTLLPKLMTGKIRIDG